MARYGVVGVNHERAGRLGSADDRRAEARRPERHVEDLGTGQVPGGIVIDGVVVTQDAQQIAIGTVGERGVELVDIGIEDDRRFTAVVRRHDPAVQHERRAVVGLEAMEDETGVVDLLLLDARLLGKHAGDADECETTSFGEDRRARPTKALDDGAAIGHDAGVAGGQREHDIVRFEDGGLLADALVPVGTR